ncbi:MAG: hypothetical protein JXB23_02735 [Candidatus Aminicenantes bacterium]|nr:hypothetical protein [Candidatus Aminicenantes bacterium]
MCQSLDAIDFEALNKTHRLGVEIGSQFFKAVALAEDGSITWQFKKAHKGDSSSLLNHFFLQLQNGELRTGIASQTPLQKFINVFDPIACLYTAARNSFPEVRNILEVGATHLTLVRLDTKGQVMSIHTNSLCAAGTGSFLDEQAKRMKINYQDMQNDPPCPDPPSIATRCAVFAKSDLVYRQQEGFAKEDMWSGLCRGLVDGVLHTLTGGRSLSGLTILCGGVALNDTFRWWLGKRLNGSENVLELKVMPNPEYTVAYGAALLSSNSHGGKKPRMPISLAEGKRKRRSPLELVRSRYPKSTAYSSIRDKEGNEVTAHFPPALSSQKIDAYLGIDIGSTSTKLVLIDREDRIVLDIYRRTEANPISAVKKLFLAVNESGRKHNLLFNIKGAATTGSGRKLIGSVIGADLIINEISAHVKGAVRIDPSVKTIFEIGGQDAKYMSVNEGHIADANMNYVCAAGTGSFIEELASKLGYTIDEIGYSVLGVTPPYTSSRCTVFMEQDIQTLLQQGITRREAAGAVMYSVIENYLERVVGRRPISRDRIFFQGATARNPGLIAAIENLLGVEVVASPYCHVMGAYGAALLVKEKMNGGKSKFRSFDLGSKNITVTSEKCSYCSNHCTLSRALIENEKDNPLWGMKCGREEGATKMRNPEEYSLYIKVLNLTWRFGARELSHDHSPEIIIPRMLSAYSFYPFWKSFFDAIGIRVRLSDTIDHDCIAQGNECTGSGFCLPAKAAIGQVARLLKDKKTGKIFVPHMMADYELDGLTHSRFCPYVESLPSLIKPSFKNSDQDKSRIVSPIIDLRLTNQKNAEALVKVLNPFVSVKQTDAEIALQRAHSARKEYEEQLGGLGEDALAKIKKAGKPAVVVVGRPYNTLDSEINQNIPYHIAECGIDVIPMACLPWDASLLTGEFENLFWSYGQRIVSALIQIARTEGLYAVFLSNFACGPDSFLLTYAETVMGNKPFLVLELDEHGSSGGYQTRIEAFLEVVKADWQSNKSSIKDWTPPREAPTVKDVKERTIWIPTMHSVGNRLFAATFKSQGYDARTLPPEDESSFSLGKRWTRGAECLPAVLTLGTFLKQMDKERESGRKPGKESALFLPTSDGPCRFGQYRTLNRIVLDCLGLNDLPILSPGAHNAYYGLDRSLRANLWESILASDILFKMRCRVLPYEATKGDTVETLEQVIGRAEELIGTSRMNWGEFLIEAMREFQKIPVDRSPRPLVGVVGEIYVRCNTYANSSIIEAIEKLGGEAWLSPLSEWILYTAWMERYLARRKKTSMREKLELALKWQFLSKKEHRFYRAVKPLLNNRKEPSIEETIRAAEQLLPTDFEGESILTLGRTILFQKDQADLVVNCSPFGCMHGNITSEIFERIREDIGIPVVTVFYDGMEDNTILSAYLHEVKERKKRTWPH